jgi:hypothetical protein
MTLGGNENVLTFSVNKNINDVIKVGYLTESRPTSDIGRAWWSEVWIKTLDEKADGPINVEAYGHACEKNTQMAISSKEVAMLTVEELEMGQRGVADTVASYLDINIDTIIESSEVRTLVDEFLTVQDQLSLEEGVSLWKVMTLARQANMKMIEKLRELIGRYSIENLVEGVLRNRECLKVLEGALA